MRIACKMRSQWASLFLLSFYSIAVCGATRSNEADRLVAMMHWKPHTSPHKEPWVQPNAFSVFIGPQDELMEADRITALPGQPGGVNFSQYSGYVTVDPGAGRALFYYFVEAMHNSSQKPLVLWLNGGPGCSSLGAGAMLELGPFSVNKDGNTLYKNEYAWNNVANMLFLESPAGVGFSYSNTSSDYDKNGDNRTAEDTYTFLINWLERFPQFKGRDFFITGESYAGHYIPELANVIIANNNKKNATTINLKGIAIGNAYVDDDTNLKGNYEYYYTHALISKEAHEAIQANCNFTGHGSHSPECQKGLDLAGVEKGMIDVYNIYAPLCPTSGSVPSDDLIGISDPCVENYIHSYLNLAEVQNSLHANTSLGYKWSECSDLTSFGNWNDRPVSMLPAIKQVIDSGISVWLYSGDIDSVVSVTATQYFLDDLNLPIEASWRPWSIIDNGGFSQKDIDIDHGQVGGYVVSYKGLVFATVRGAGHMVPRNRPKSALILFSSFLQGKLPPT